MPISFRIAAVLAVMVLFAAGISAQDLTPVGAYDSLGYAYNVVVRGSYAYACDAGRGLVILDVTNPATPAFVGSFDPTPAIFDVDIDSNMAYLAGGYWEPYLGVFYAVDISDRTAPILLDTLSFAFERKAVAVMPGHYAFLIDGGHSILAIDIRRPDSLFVMNTFTISGYAQDLVFNRYLYVAAGNAGLVILDVADPYNMTVVGSCDTPGFAKGVSLGNLPRGYAFVADNTEGLQVIDIHNPQAPVIVGSLPTSAAAMAIDVNGSYAYLALGDSGLVAVRVSVPAAPVTVASATTGGRVLGVDRDYDYAYVASGESMKIFSFNPTVCNYVPGDINGSGHVNGLDVSFAVAFFKGAGPLPYRCDCPPHGQIYPAGDVNASCAFNGVDITYMLNYYSGTPPPLLYCPDCPPIR